MNITYLWTAPSGYLLACVEELIRRRRHGVSLFTLPPADDAPFTSPAAPRPWHKTLTPSEQTDYASLRRAILDTQPDVLVFAGWSQPHHRRLIYDRQLAGVKFVLCADTPIRFDWRQFVARLKIGRLLRAVDAVCVPGERGYQVMRYWRVPEHKIFRLLYGIDFELFDPTGAARPQLAQDWPRGFLFAGRYAHVKGIAPLLDAYQRYRNAVRDPWTLTCCGVGPLGSQFSGVPGVVDVGFQQPEALAPLFGRASVFVLPSVYEPWGQVIVEAAAAGMPVICTEACGASPEIVRHLWTGMITPTGDAAALASAFIWIHNHADRLPAMGAAARHMARPFAASAWAENQERMVDALTSAGDPLHR